MTTAAVERAAWRGNLPAVLAGAAAAAATVSIAASQILLGLAIVALLAVPRHPLRWPPVTIPLLLWMAWTVLSLSASADPIRGLAQVKKFYVYLFLFAVYAALRSLKEVRRVAAGWAAGAALSSLWAAAQFVQKYVSTPEYFDYVYSNQRVTGFMDHWMTFSGVLMIALMSAGAWLLFARGRRGMVWWMAACAALIALGLLLSWTRSAWLGAAVGGVWLLWSRRRALVALLPLAAAVVLAASPGIRGRVFDVFHPRYNMLNVGEHRFTLLVAGWEMIKAHPWVGVGPEQVGPQFLSYLPPEVPRPISREWYYGHLHNIYVHFAAERGLPALLALLALLGKALFDFTRGLRRLPRDAEARWVLHAAVASILAVMTAGLFEVNLGDSEVLAMFLSTMACGYVALKDSDPLPAGR
jgi:putative inorganic carbon (HCO3(-)) transporter